MRVVLDTNTVLSALLFPRGRLTWIRDLWTTARILPLVCHPTVRELLDALAYPKFKLDAGEIETLLARYLPFTETVFVPDSETVTVPACSDPDDQPFLQLASIGQAEVLVTGDHALLALAGSVPFSIETAAQFRKRFA